MQSFSIGKSQPQLFLSLPAASHHPMGTPDRQFPPHNTSRSPGPGGFVPRPGNPVPIQRMCFPLGRTHIYCHPLADTTCLGTTGSHQHSLRAIICFKQNYLNLLSTTHSEEKEGLLIRKAAKQMKTHPKL